MDPNLDLFVAFTEGMAINRTLPYIIYIYIYIFIYNLCIAYHSIMLSDFGNAGIRQEPLVSIEIL